MSVRSRILGPPVPKMPSGLVELMDGLARDVLKNNPENIYEFCARHMQTLLEIRDGRAIRPLVTLDQKIEKAQKIIKQRAEQRQLEYDRKKADDIKEQQMLSTADTPCCDVDSEYSDKEKMEKVSIDIQPKQQEAVINVIEKQVFEKPVGLINELISETNKEHVFNKIDNLGLEEKENENNSDQDILTVIDSNINEKSNALTEDEPETDDNIKGNETYNSLGDDQLKEVQSIVITSDITEGDNVNVTELLPAETVIKIENDNSQHKIILHEDNDIRLNNEHIDVLNKGTSELQDEVEINMKDESDEIRSTDIIEEVVTPSDNSEKQVDAPSTNSSLNDNDVEATSEAEITNSLTIKQIEDLNEKSGGDKIITVIQDCNTDSALQNIEPDANQQLIPESISNEFNQKAEQNIDNEIIPEIAHEKDKSIDINSSMDLETAAITIQKVFRSFLFKTKTASYDDSTTVDITLLTEDKEKEENQALNVKDRRPLGISRMDTVLQTVNEEKSLSLSTDDSSTLSSAATIIQAHVRGFLVRNKLNLNKTISTNSLIDSDAPSIPSLEADSDNVKNKTVLNIHIVPEGGHYVSRDESILTSMDLSLDSSPPSSVNLHPLGYDKSERRKQLKREDAIQSVSPPSNNSGKLSEDHDSVKEVLTIENNAEIGQVTVNEKTSVEAHDTLEKGDDKVISENDSNIGNPTLDAASDEMDVITPFVEDRTSRESDNSTKLLHSGEFHDIVVPTNVTRSDAAVVRGE